MALLVEQTQDAAMAYSEDLAVVLIAVTLATVLLTALIAAIVTRRITLPIIQLTATAVQIAAGDLDDPNSIVSRLVRSNRAFRLLEDVGTHPKTIYLQEGE